MSDSTIIFSSRVWVNQKLQPASIEIKDGKIFHIDIGAKSRNAINYDNAVIMPGVIDAHVHINEPGRAEWEGFETATKAAARGGTTTLVDMPLNSSPVVTTVEAFDKKIASTINKLHVNCGFWAGAVDDNTDAIMALIEKGCLGVKVFLSHSGLEEFPNISLEHLDTLMQWISYTSVPVLAHCELEILPVDSNIKNQPTSYSEYLKSRPRTWENEAIKAFVHLSEKHHCRAHIVHLSSHELINWLDQKRKSGIPVSIETCPHYLIFNAEEINDGNTLFKCAPPIREQSNNECLINGIKSGVIDFITTDHSPSPPDGKEMETGNFQKAWGGISGLQFLLSAGWTALKSDLPLDKFIPLLTSGPAQFLGLNHQIGFVKKGYFADFTIWNPETDFIVQKEAIEHRHKISPYVGKKLFGEVYSTIVNGHVVYEQNAFKTLRKGRLIL